MSYRIKAGLPPGELIHVGVKHEAGCVLRTLQYNLEKVQENTFEKDSISHASPATDMVNWFHVEGLHDVSIIESLGRKFSIHSLVLEDILNTHQRPKREESQQYLFITLKRLQAGEEGQAPIIRQFSLILLENTVITFQESADQFLEPLFLRIKESKGIVRSMNADYLVFAILDLLIDQYFVVIENIGDSIDDFEQRLADMENGDLLQDLHVFKRNLIEIRRITWPLRDVIGGLERGSSIRFSSECLPYLRDLYDHTIQIVDMVESLRDSASGLMDLYLSSISNRMNSVMKVLTIIATLFIPLTFIAGIYGMNFEVMPELKWRWAYPACLAFMAAISCGLLVYFRKKRWL